MSRPDLSPAIIDATDAEVLAPEGTLSEFTAQQTDQLDRCQFHLHRLSRRIGAREMDLIYLYVEAGFYLLKAQEIHRASHVRQSETGRFSGREDGGLSEWLESAEVNIPRSSAYRYMQGARNCGLTADSHIVALNAIKEEKRLQGRTLTDVCRKPVYKLEDEPPQVLTPEQEAAARLETIRESWRQWGEFAVEQGIDARSWKEIPDADRAALCKMAHELHRLLKESLRKPLPAPAVPATAPKETPDANAKPTPELDGDRVCTQTDIERGLWWWGWTGFRGTIMLKTYTGDMAVVIAARSDPRIGKTVIGPFFAETQGDAEKIVAQRDINAII